MMVRFVLWAALTLLTIGLSLATVARAREGELAAGRALRRRGLWILLPQVAVFLVLLLAGLLLG